MGCTLARADRVRDDGAMNRTALVIGESLVDIVSNSDGSSVEHPGGSPANVAVALARLGAGVGLATAYADDRLGGLLDQHFAHAGVSLAGDPHVLARTSSAVATLDDTGAASYVFDLEWDLPPLPTADPPALVHTGSLGAVMEPGAGTVAAIIEALAPTSTSQLRHQRAPGRDRSRRRDRGAGRGSGGPQRRGQGVRRGPRGALPRLRSRGVRRAPARARCRCGRGHLGRQGRVLPHQRGQRRGGRRTGGGGRHDRGRGLVLRGTARRPPAPGPARRSAAVRPATRCRSKPGARS